MIADLVTHLRNLPDHTPIKRLRHQPEIVGSADPPFMLNTGKPKRMLLASIHIMAEEDDPFRLLTDDALYMHTLPSRGSSVDLDPINMLLIGLKPLSYSSLKPRNFE